METFKDLIILTNIEFAKKWFKFQIRILIANICNILYKFYANYLHTLTSLILKTNHV